MLHFRRIDATRNRLFRKCFSNSADLAADSTAKPPDSGAKTADFEPEDRTDSSDVSDRWIFLNSHGFGFFREIPGPRCVLIASATPSDSAPATADSYPDVLHRRFGASPDFPEIPRISFPAARGRATCGLRAVRPARSRAPRRGPGARSWATAASCLRGRWWFRRARRH